ncbi:hypothetical protein CDL12_12877 [Handroanthus impetiginosus]|uniref:Uncharacterized protein n=1 Tax=Handroanthus impetiginosus TaxID=429701 RepID=A0A2G9HAE3_9LAMI|nr:hypothetical protein CDL12_12877 [Handroanthus impetiginosus]
MANNQCGRKKRSRRKGLQQKSSITETHNEHATDPEAITNGRNGIHSTNEVVDDYLSEVHHIDMENEEQEKAETNHKKRKTREKTYMPSVWTMRGCKRIHFNKLGLPIGENKSKFVEFLGSLVRNGKLIRLDTPTWHKVSWSVKNSLLEIVKVIIFY